MFHKIKFRRNFLADYGRHSGRSNMPHERYVCYNACLRKEADSLANLSVYEEDEAIVSKIGKFKEYLRDATVKHGSMIHPNCFAEFMKWSDRLLEELAACNGPGYGTQALHVFTDTEGYVWGLFLVTDSVPAAHPQNEQLGTVGIWSYLSYTTPGATTVTRALENLDTAASLARRR